MNLHELRSSKSWGKETLKQFNTYEIYIRKYYFMRLPVNFRPNGNLK